MADASFVQTTFVGGEWSEVAQGRMQDPRYTTALSRAQNCLFLESGAWTRRPGFRYVITPYGGGKARLISWDTDADYQLVLTDERMQFIQGFLPVVDTSVTTYVWNISTATPAVVQMPEELSANFVDGDIVTFITDNEFLVGRSFLIDNVTTDTFELYDPVTGDPIDGTDIAYVMPVVPDTVFRWQTLETPWDEDDIDDIRYAQRPEDVFFFHNDYPVQKLTLVDGFFALEEAEFEDGPYMDENQTTTTLTPSGNGPTGITLTASATTGINDDEGWLTTDVGRFVRVRGGFGSWSAVTTYPNNAIVTGSDGNTYVSQKGGNLNHDPSTDDGEWWIVSGSTANWTHYIITGWVSSTVVNVERLGVAISILAQTVWRLGLYSETTGYPSIGTYHEGRLWLAGAFPNRVDGSVSNEPENFQPTAADGSVADNNAVSAVFNAQEPHNMVWVNSTEGGLILGSDHGEWRVRASTLDDPISPTSIQARLVSTHGCAFVDPVDAYGEVWVQSRKRKILATGAIGDERYSVDNLTVNADHVTGTGIEELRYMQEPCLSLIARRADGGLWAGAYRRNPQSEEGNYIGWSEFVHGMGRVFESISVGPSYDGLASALYVVTNQPDDTKPDYNVRWVEVIMPVLDSGRESFAAWFVDGGTQPQYSSVDGNTITIGGLWHLEGYSIQPFSGGLDLGDYTVTNGEIEITFGDDPEEKFTTAFAAGLTDGTDYGPFSWTVVTTTVTPEVPSVAQDTFSVAEVTESGVSGDRFHLDRGTDRLILCDAVTEEIHRVAHDTGNFIGTVTATGLQSPNAFIDNVNYVVSGTSTGNSRPLIRFNVATGASVTYGTTSISQSQSVSNRIVAPHEIIQTKVIGGREFMISNGITSVNAANEIAILIPDWFDDYPSLDPFIHAERFASHTYMKMARGFEREDRSSFLVCVFDGADDDGASATTFSIYEVYVGGIVIHKRLVKTFTPTTYDALWTTIELPGMAACPDGSIILCLNQNTGTGAVARLIKLDLATGTTIWNTSLTEQITIHRDTVLRGQWFQDVYSDGGVAHTRNFDLTTGAVTTRDFPDSNVAPVPERQLWSDILASVWMNATGATNETDDWTMFGDQAIADGGLDTGSDHNTCQLFMGPNEDYPDNAISESTDTDTYIIPAAFGVTFVSRGQLLRPDYGPDSGARNGPGFAKKRRLHWWAGAFVRSQKTYVGTDFDVMRPVRFQTLSGVDVETPTYFDGTVTTTVDNDYSWNGKIAWEVRRPFPCTLSAVGGYIQTQDK